MVTWEKYWVKCKFYYSFVMIFSIVIRRKNSYNSSKRSKEGENKNAIYTVTGENGFDCTGRLYI